MKNKKNGKVFRELLNLQSQHSHSPIKYYTVKPEGLDLTNDVIRTVLNALNNSKAPGEDGLAGELKREALWYALITFGISAKTVKMITLCMNKTRC